MSSVVVFDGSKCFWKTKNTVDILIVEHNESNSVEIIAYEPSFNKESPRIYLNKTMLATKIDPSFVDGKLRTAKEQCLRRHQVPDVLQLLQEINQKARVDYILNRLFITEFTPESKKMTLGIQFNFRDRDDEQECSFSLEDMITPPPTDLVPYVSPHHETIMVETVNEMLQALEDEKESLRQLRAKADLHEAKARALLGNRERWRIPIVMQKVASGRRLSISDAIIWNVISKRLVMDEDCDIAHVIESALTTGANVRSVDAGTSTDVPSTTSSKPVFNKQKPARRSMVPAAMFSQPGNAAIIKEAAAPAVSNTPTPKRAVSQRSVLQKSQKAASDAAGGDDAISATGGLISAVTTSFKKRLGLNKAATTSQLPVPVQTSVPAEKDENSGSRRSGTATNKLYRSSTAGSAKPAVISEQPSTTPVARTPKPAIPKYSPPTLRVQTSFRDSGTPAPSPMAKRFAATLGTWSESIRGSFSFKRNFAIGVAAEDEVEDDALLPTGESECGHLQPTASYKEACEADKTPVLTRRPSLELDAAPVLLEQGDELQAGASNCEPSDTLGSPRLKAEAAKPPHEMLPSAAVAVPTDYHPVSTASASADSVTRSLAAYKSKQAAAKRAKSDVKPDAKPAANTKPAAEPAPIVGGWLSWGSQKKATTPATPMETSTTTATAAITPRKSSSAVLAVAAATSTQENSHNAARGASSRAAVNYQELVVKRQQQAEQGSSRGEAKNSSRKAPGGAMRQIWSSLLGSDNQKVTPVE